MITITDLETQLEELVNRDIDLIDYNAIDFSMHNIALTISYNNITSELMFDYVFERNTAIAEITTTTKGFTFWVENLTDDIELIYATMIDEFAKIINEYFN